MNKKRKKSTKYKLNVHSKVVISFKLLRELSDLVNKRVIIKMTYFFEKYILSLETFYYLIIFLLQVSFASEITKLLSVREK